MVDYSNSMIRRMVDSCFFPVEYLFKDNICRFLCRCNALFVLNSFNTSYAFRLLSLWQNKLNLVLSPQIAVRLLDSPSSFCVELVVWYDYFDDTEISVS
jgi:hypothetical protein